MRIFTTILLFFTLPLLAQPTDPKEKLKSADFLIGNWNVEVDARLSLHGPWERSKGTSVIRKTLDSSLIEEEFTGTREGKPFLSKTLFAVNNMTDKIQRIFIDAPHGVLLDFEGVMVNDSLVFDKTWKYANGNSVRLGVTYKKLSADSFVLTTRRMPDGATSWDVNGRMTYTRVK
ncbi:MAG TPA: DUF1579 family protein [Anaerolineales bacterium]|nr:DUF1579 family protein [Anaerolineales bacterium]